MPDRIEREIEEILEKLDTELPPERSDRAPISILSRRKKGASPKPSKSRPQSPRAPMNISPTTLMFIGAALVVGGLLLSNAWGPIIWVAFGGVVLFIGAFLSSFLRHGGPGGPSQPRGVYWRDRYIAYEPEPTDSAMARLKRRFRRH
jgi:hypothetical protein